MPTTVVNIRRDTYDVYIGRGTKWGNPYVIGLLTREECIEKYRAHLLSKQYLLDSLPELKDKVLGCHCAPEACHGDILAELANKL